MVRHVLRLDCVGGVYQQSGGGTQGRTLMAHPVKPDRWMPLYFGDYLADTMHLNTEQHGAYMLLLMAEWKAGGYLPDHDSQLAAITKLPPDTWRSHRPVLQAFFTVQNGRWHQKRLLRELKDACHIIKVNRENGKLGGRPRKPKANPNESEQKPIGFDTGKPNGNRNESQTKHHHHHKEDLKTFAQGFARFWEAYPRKRDKPRALKTWQKIKPDAELTESMLTAIDSWKLTADWQRDGGQYIPYPASWLKGRCWEDELQAEPNRERKVAL